MILSWLNSIALVYLLVLHFRQKWGTMTFWSLMTKVKTSILVLLLIFEVIVAVRYTITFENRATYSSFLIIQQFLQSIILF